MSKIKTTNKKYYIVENIYIEWNTHSARFVKYHLLYATNKWIKKYIRITVVHFMTLIATVLAIFMDIINKFLCGD